MLGLVRDVLIARIFGSEDAADAFFVAFRIPNFFRRLFSEGAFSQAFVPVLSDLKANRKQPEIHQFINRVAGTLGSALLLFTLLGVIAASGVTLLFAPGFWDEPSKFELTRDLLRITFPYLLFISLAGFSGAILNTYNRFSAPAATPILLNLSLILAALFATDWFAMPIFALAWGVLVAGVLQLIFQLPFLMRIHLLPVPQWHWLDSDVKRVLTLMVPFIFGVSVSQINLLLDTLIASFLTNGSVSWLYYSDRIVELPLGVFGIAIATIILPQLSKQHVAQKEEDFNKTLDWAIRMILVISIPATLAIIVLGKPILSTLFQYGAMTQTDIAMATLSLSAYSLGLLGFMLVKVLAPGFFSRQDTRTPVRIGIIAMVSNMVLNLVFVLPLYHYAQIGHVGLALATSVAAWINATLLFITLKRNAIYQPGKGWKQFFWKLAVANILMLLLLIVCTQYWNDWDNWDLWQRSSRLLISCLGAGLVYLGGLYILGLKIKGVSIT